MGESIQRMRTQLNDFWSNLEKNKKIKLGIGGLLIILSITALIFVTTRTKYEVLFSELTPKDAGLVIKELDEKNVKWKDDNNGTSILVPESMKNKLKMELALEGLPKDGYSFVDAFNDTSWTMTEYEKKQRNKYALESTLSANITEIEGIESARVYLKIPDNTSYVLNNNEAPSASVFVTLSRGNDIQTTKVQGIQNLVASAVGMKPESVSVVDDLGKLLSSMDENQEGIELTDQFNMQQSLQLRVNDSIKSFLENVFGYGNVVVRAGVKVNFDSEITNIVEFGPPIEGAEEGLVRSMEKIEEHMVNMINGGVPGVETNIEDITNYVQLEGENSKYDKASETINFELNEINKQIKKAPGQIESITVAIILNKEVLPEGELTDELREEISSLIYAATGLDTKQVQVSGISFNNGLADQNNFEGEETNGLQPWLKYLIIGLVAAAASAILTVIVYRKRKQEEIDINEIIEQKANEMSVIEEIDFNSEKSKVKEQINNFVDKKPDAVAQMLRTWLNEE